LVVAGETIVGGSPLSMAGKLASSNRVPLLSIATRSFMLQRQIAGDEVVDGPYALIELDRALASMSPPGVATC
jgi:hypothetical protein